MSVPARQLPALDPDTAFYWQAGAQGQLQIARCTACRRYTHPPLPRCPSCGGQTAPEPVSGKGRVASFTINHQPWLPGLPVPYVFAAVALAEQEELYVLTNIIGCTPESVSIGMKLRVCFEPHGDVYLPMFQPDESNG